MSLSLNQKRAQEAFKTSFYSNWENEVKAIVGNGVSIEVAWDTLYNFTEESSAQDVSEFWGKLYFSPLKTALAGVCSDAMGKEALTSKLKKIVIKGENESWDSSAATFTDGIFTINQMPFSESENESTRADTWKDILEAGL